MIAVFVVDSQEMPRLFVEFPSAFGTDQAMNLERPLPIIAPSGSGFLQSLEGLFNGLIVSCLFRRRFPKKSVGLVFH